MKKFIMKTGFDKCPQHPQIHIQHWPVITGRTWFNQNDEKNKSLRIWIKGKIGTIGITSSLLDRGYIGKFVSLYASSPKCIWILIIHIWENHSFIAPGRSINRGLLGIHLFRRLHLRLRVGYFTAEFYNGIKSFFGMLVSETTHIHNLQYKESKSVSWKTIEQRVSALKVTFSNF